MTIRRLKTRRLLASVALGAVMAASGAGLAAAQTATPAASAAGAEVPANPASLLPHETYRLANGLTVIFNIDRSDPVVAVALTAHVGSARETPGRTGFAHMFEHLFFLDSENLGPGGLDRMSARIGGSGANGFTSNDITVYLQTVPSDALEKMIWAEADKLGYFINTVTDAVLTKEKEVVKNEKRQSYDNRPYGQTAPVVSAALYPADHPYSWTTIGSMADLNAATLEDVKSFYRQWYTPDNATLIISGDFAWFDETLDHASYGVLRGSGLLRRYGVGDDWKIEQYVLSLAVPNDLASPIARIIKTYEAAREDPAP